MPGFAGIGAKRTRTSADAKMACPMRATGQAMYLVANQGLEPRTKGL